MNNIDKKRKWMWISLLAPIVTVVTGFILSGITGVIMTDCLFPPSGFSLNVSVPTVSVSGGEASAPSIEAPNGPSAFCQTTNFIAFNLLPKITAIGSILFLPGIVLGIILFFLSRKPKNTSSIQ